MTTASAFPEFIALIALYPYLHTMNLVCCYSCLLLRSGALLSVVSNNSILPFPLQNVHENILGLLFRISPDAFFQTNSRATEVLYRQVRDLCSHGNHTDAAASTVSQQPTIYGVHCQCMYPCSKYLYHLDNKWSAQNKY